MDHPLLVEFVPGTVVTLANTVTRGLPIVGNGPPGTTITFPNGRVVSLPTDQIVAVTAAPSGAAVAFGGMSFEGVHEGQLVFNRIKDLAPEHTLSPERGRRMTLQLEMVARVLVHGGLVWTAPGLIPRGIESQQK